LPLDANAHVRLVDSTGYTHAARSGQPGSVDIDALVVDSAIEWRPPTSVVGLSLRYQYTYQVGSDTDPTAPSFVRSIVSVGLTAVFPSQTTLPRVPYELAARVDRRDQQPIEKTPGPRSSEP
jgi:hypothetical protein